MLIFSPKDDASDIQKKLDEIYNIQERNQFGDERYAIAFMPGDYGKSLQVNVGYYTQVLGLGVLPTDTNINKLWVDASWMNHNATCNFWRGAENFSINEYCMWANSQAVSLRRINSEDGIVLSDGPVAASWQILNLMATCLQAPSSNIYVEMMNGITGKAVFGTWCLQGLEHL